MNELETVNEIAKLLPVLNQHGGDAVLTFLFLAYVLWNYYKKKKYDPNGDKDKKSTRISIKNIETRQGVVMTRLEGVEKEVKENYKELQDLKTGVTELKMERSNAAATMERLFNAVEKQTTDLTKQIDTQTRLIEGMIK